MNVIMKLKNRTWVAPALSVLGLLYFASRLFFHANNQISVLDEGAYQLKGLLFLNGTYWPFEDYGPLTNHMPLSFILPGIIQVVFGPGLWAARSFSILLGCLFLVGLWFVSRRLGGRWWAAIVIWSVAINPAIAKLYSVGTSQVLVAFMLVWILALTIGEGRTRWQLVAGTTLAAVLALTRINLVPVLPIVVIYIYWQHGRKHGHATAAAGLGVFLIGHAIFFPGILKLWANWIPRQLSPFLDAWRAPEGIRGWDPQIGFHSRVISFFHGFRFHFLAMVGAISALIIWPESISWKKSSDRGVGLYLSLLFGVLFFAHLAASLGLNYCVFCFPIYQSFYVFIGLLLFVNAIQHFPVALTPLRQAAVSLTVLILFGGIGFSAFEDLGPSLLAIPVPRIKSFQILPGEIELWGLFANRFGMTYTYLLRLLPLAAGILLGILFILISFLILRLLRKHQTHLSFGIVVLFGLLIVGFLLSPTQYLGAAYRTYDSCEGNVISSYNEVGADLASKIPPGSQVYWQGGMSAAPLLYLEEVSIYPAQINQVFNFYLSGSDAEINRFSYWSEPLAVSWLENADYALVVDQFLEEDWVKEIILDGERYTEIPGSPRLATCDAYAKIRVFKRNQSVP